MGREDNFRGDMRDEKVITAVDAVELLRKSVLEEPPKLEDLPKQLDISSLVRVMPEAVASGDMGDGISILEMLRALRRVNDAIDCECGCAIVADHKGDMQFGQIQSGERHSVKIAADLQRREFTTESGLIVCRDDIFAATLHSHGTNNPFSLMDIYSGFLSGERQKYIIRADGTIDMLHITQDSKLLSKETFKKLVSLWSGYLSPDGELREGLTIEQIDEFIKRVINSALQMGFYTNRDSSDPRKLKLKEWKNGD